MFVTRDSCEQGLLKFVLPLGLVYFAEYFINQGLVSASAPPSVNLVSLQGYVPLLGFSCNVLKHSQVHQEFVTLI